MDSSNLRMISTGIAASDKPNGSKYLNVFPSELFPFFEGDISDIPVQSVVKGKDIDGEPFSISLYQSMVLKAGWLGETNRRTAPNIKAGEQVRLWTVGNTEIYFWDSSGRDDKLRRGEIVTWAWDASGKDSSQDVDHTDENTYNLTIDTVGQQITLSTSNVNGEVTSYKVQLDTKDGTFTVLDGFGNAIQLNSKDTKITLVNKDATTIVLDKKEILISAPDKITALAKDIIMKAENKIELKAKDIECTASVSFTIRSPKILLDGQVTATKNVVVAAMVKAKSILSKSGNIKSFVARSISASSASFSSHGPH